MIVRLRELRSNEAICRYDNIKKKEDDPMSSLKDKTVTMAHGAGGRQTSELIDKIFAVHFANPDLTADDAAVLIPPAGKMAVSTDGFIVSPAFFPGGNIGKLSICGTVNDLACMGAKPLYLTCAFVIEEGFPMEKLEEIAAAMEKMLNMSQTELMSAMQKIYKNQWIATDLSLEQISMVADFASQRLTMDNVNVFMVPGEGATYYPGDGSAQSVYSIHKSATVDLLNQYFRPYQNEIYPEESTIVELVPEGEYLARDYDDTQENLNDINKGDSNDGAQ